MYVFADKTRHGLDIELTRNQHEGGAKANFVLIIVN